MCDPAHEMCQLGDGLAQRALDTFALDLPEAGCQIAPLPQAAARQRGDALEVAQKALDLRRLHGLALKLLLGAQVEPRLLEQPLSGLGRAGAPGDIERLDLPGGEPMLGCGTGQALAVLAALARQRHQGSQRRLHRDPALAQMLLDRLWQDLDHRQPARDPARTAAETLGKLLQVQAEAALQLRQKPALLQRAGAWRHLQRARQHQGIGL